MDDLIFIVTGWKAGERYEQKCAGLHAAKMYFEYAARRYFTVRVTDQAGKVWTLEELDSPIANPTSTTKEQ